MTAGENRSPGPHLADARVRQVFHAALISHLEAFGAESVSEIRRQRFSCFGLPLTEGEIQTLVESTRRHGLVEPLGHDRTASGSPIRMDEWIPTKRGRRIKPVRTLAPRHLLLSMRDIANPARQFFSAWISIATLVASLVLVKLSEPSPALRAAIVGVSSALVLYFVLVRAITTEYSLRAAARAWPRLDNARPAQYRWHTVALRFWPGPIALSLLGAAAVVVVLVDWVPAAALAAVGLLFGLVAAILISPLRADAKRPLDT